MAISFVGAGAVVVGGGTPFALNGPDGVLAGDLVLTVSMTRTDLPSGFTRIATDALALSVCWARAAGSADHTNVIAAPFYYAGQAFVFRGVAAVGNPFEQAPTVNGVLGTGGAPPTVPGVTVLTSNATVLCISYAFERGQSFEEHAIVLDPISGPATTRRSIVNDIVWAPNRDHMAIGIWTGTPGTGPTANQVTSADAFSSGPIDAVGGLLLTLAGDNQVTYGAGRGQTGIMT